MAIFKQKPVQEQRTVPELIGDFYESYAREDEEKMAYCLHKLQNAIFTGETDGTPFMEYFNDIYSGRNACNMLASVSDYPFESIIRELFQNAFGCRYETKDIKIFVDFLPDNQISIAYNEIGFTMEEILYYLSFGRNNGDRNREGRFGVGAKSVFKNVEWLNLKSNNFNFRIQQNGSGSLLITELNLFGNYSQGTKITFKVSTEQYNAINENFNTLTDKKGEFINLVELCFAFNRKKALDPVVDDRECKDRTFTVAVLNNGNVSNVYTVFKTARQENVPPLIRFTQNGKSIVDFLNFEDGSFVYLIPFAIANAKRKEMVRVLLQKYNYFSTYELTGLIKKEEEALNDKLSAFFISVPNKYITSQRTGIKHESESSVVYKTIDHIQRMLHDFKAYFVLDLIRAEDGKSYLLRSKSYPLDFFANFMKTSNLASKIKSNFQNALSLRFSEDVVLNCGQLKEGSYAVNSKISVQDHNNPDSYKKYITDVINKMEEKLADEDEKFLYSGYIWNSEDGAQKGREFEYHLHKDGFVYTVTSQSTPKTNDYALYECFDSYADRMIKNRFPKTSVDTEEDLEILLSAFDEIIGDGYDFEIRYNKCTITCGEETYSYDATCLKINNLKSLEDSIAKRSGIFETGAVRLETLEFIVNCYMDRSRVIEKVMQYKADGGKIIVLKASDRAMKFKLLESEFPVEDDLTISELLAVLEPSAEIALSGILNNRRYDAPANFSEYKFDSETVKRLLGKNKILKSDVKEAMERINCFDFASDCIALVNDKDIIFKVANLNEPLSKSDHEKVVKYLVLRSDLSKIEFAGVLEHYLTGENAMYLNEFYSKTEEPNQLNTAQMPYRMKPLPHITSKELDQLRTLYKKVAGVQNPSDYRNYFARDLSPKLFGYGGICSFCGCERDVLNSFKVKDFSLNCADGEAEKQFHFAVYLCENDALAAKGWVVAELLIGGKTPFEWLRKVSAANEIAPDDLMVTFKFRAQVTTDIFTANDKNGERNVVNSSVESFDFVLSPLMAACWIEENVNK